MQSRIINLIVLGVVAQANYPNTPEVEAGIHGQFGLQETKRQTNRSSRNGFLYFFCFVFLLQTQKTPKAFLHKTKLKITVRISEQNVSNCFHLNLRY